MDDQFDMDAHKRIARLNAHVRRGWTRSERLDLMFGAGIVAVLASMLVVANLV